MIPLPQSGPGALGKHRSRLRPLVLHLFLAGTRRWPGLAAPAGSSRVSSRCRRESRWYPVRIPPAPPSVDDAFDTGGERRLHELAGAVDIGAEHRSRVGNPQPIIGSDVE